MKQPELNVMRLAKMISLGCMIANITRVRIPVKPGYSPEWVMPTHLPLMGEVDISIALATIDGILVFPGDVVYNMLTGEAFIAEWSRDCDDRTLHGTDSTIVLGDLELSKYSFKPLPKAEAIPKLETV